MTARALPGTQDAIYPFWSPDSREIGFFAAGKLKKINADDGPPQDICDSLSGRGGAWSKDGVIVFTPSSGQPLFRVPASGGVPEPASKLDASLGQNSHRWPFFLPDGKHFIFWARSSRSDPVSMLYVGELGKLDAKPLMKSETMAEYASGRLLFLRDQTLMAQPFDPDRMSLGGEPVPLAEHIAINGATVHAMFSASESGALVYQTGDASSGWNLLWRERDGKQDQTVNKPEHYVRPTISPDGKRIAVSFFAGNQGTADVWIIDLERNASTRLTFGPASQWNAVWSADGKTIFCSSNAKGADHIYAKAADGSGSEGAILEEPDATEIPRAVSPDGLYLVFTRRKNGESIGHIWALPLSGEKKPFPIIEDAFEESSPALSASGKWMAYQSNESGRNEIYITAFPGGGAKWQVSTNGGIAPKWRRDGKEMFFLDGADNLMAVDFSSGGTVPKLGTPNTLFQTIGIQRDFGPFDVSADGKRFLLNSGNLKEGADPLTLVLNWPGKSKR
jgi:Tol biopolymer transport system component